MFAMYGILIHNHEVPGSIPGLATERFTRNCKPFLFVSPLFQISPFKLLSG